MSIDLAEVRHSVEMLEKQVSELNRLLYQVANTVISVSSSSSETNALLRDLFNIFSESKDKDDLPYPEETLNISQIDRSSIRGV